MKKQSLVWSRFESFFLSSRFHYLLILTGVIIRLRQYFFCRDLWVDEAMIALNVINRSYSELLQSLDYFQVSPLGFLFLQKTMVVLFGSSELVLRFWPLVFGIAAIFTFYKLLKATASPWVVSIALFVFVFSFKLVYYSSEFKQYSLELLLSILLYHQVFKQPFEQMSMRQLLILAAFGALACWFSFTIIFVMFSVGLFLFFDILLKKQWVVLVKVLAVGGAWVFSFGIYYLSILSKYASNQTEQIDFWQNSNKFMPLMIRSQEDFKWFFSAFDEYFRYTLGSIYIESILVILLFCGFIYGLLKSKKHLIAYLLLVLIMLLVSGLQILPFSGRVLLFSSAGTIILAASGIRYLSGEDQIRKPVLLLFLGIFFFQPFAISLYQFVRPNVEEEMTPGLAYIQQNFKEGDKVYVNYFAEPAFRYYRNRFDQIEQATLIWGVDKTNRFELGPEDRQMLEGQGRVWIVNNEFEYNLLTESLDKVGILLERQSYRGGRVFLYDFSD